MQCWNIVNSTHRNKLQWNLKRNSYIFIQEMHLKMWSAKWQPFCLGLNVLKIILRCYFTTSAINHQYGIVSTKQQSHINFSSVCQKGHIWNRDCNKFKLFIASPTTIGEVWQSDGSYIGWYFSMVMSILPGSIHPCRHPLGGKGPLQSPVTTEL